MGHSYEYALAIGVLVPLISFAFLAFFGPALGKPKSSYVALLAIGISCALSTYVLIGWLGYSPDERATLTKAAAENQFHWSDLGNIQLTVGVKLDSLTVIMYFMVTFIAFWIHFFSIGYMEGHSDEVAGVSKYHRFFAYLSLFCFSMLGLVISSSLLFLFIFWELVGLCSYLLIGFYFDRKYASNAAMKAFITNRVGDLGFIVGLMMVVTWLGTLDLDGAAAEFARQYHTSAQVGFDPSSSEGIFKGLNVSDAMGWKYEPGKAVMLSGMALATLMGIGLFCGAMGKSAQFPLHVWLPDAMAGPTPVSALIHAATMVAAGVYLVARIFRLLTPDAQMFIAVIGCITLTITALIAIVQTDIKKVLAYSTLSQLGYMIFGLGVGAWVAALFHLMTHAFFKAMLFLGSGQVIEGCHHEQDIRKMGGLRRKMPVTCWTFFIGVLAIAGFGIPQTRLGLGGFFSKDEILAVGYERTFNLAALSESDEAADDAGEHAAIRTPPARAWAGTSTAGLIGSTDGPHTRALLSSEPTSRLVKASFVDNSLLAPRSSQLAFADEPAHSADHDAHHGDHTTGTRAKLAIASRLPVLPKWMFWLPIIIAYVTPFYMMRCWWLTFMGQPRDHHVYDHAHENWKMWLPLVVLALGTFISSYFLFRPQIDAAAPVATDAPAVVAIDGEAHDLSEAGDGAMMTLTHSEDTWTNPHKALGWIVGFSWIIGMGLAALIYKDGLALATRIKNALSPIHTLLDRKFFIDEIYNSALVGTTVAIAYLSKGFDKVVVDGVVNASAMITRAVAFITGRQLDMRVEKGDLGLVDALFNGAANGTLQLATEVRRPQNGRIRSYILFAAGSAAAVLLFVLYYDQVSSFVGKYFEKNTAMASGQ